MKDEDLIEAQVRARYAEYLQSVGVDAGRIAIEVLYLLPPEFVRQYTELFDASLRWIGNSGSGIDAGRVTDEAEGRARLKAQNKRDGTRVKARSDGRGGAKGGGKKYKNSWLILDADALAAKKRVDRRLKTLVVDIIRAAGNAGKMDEVTEQSGNGGRTARSCPECGRGYGRGWVRCPFHE